MRRDKRFVSGLQVHHLWIEFVLVQIRYEINLKGIYL